MSEWKGHILRMKGFIFSVNASCHRRKYTPGNHGLYLGKAAVQFIQWPILSGLVSVNLKELIE